MRLKNPAAVALGKIKTEKKAQAARINGTRGGRPRAKSLKCTRCKRMITVDKDGTLVSHGPGRNSVLCT